MPRPPGGLPHLDPVSLFPLHRSAVDGEALSMDTCLGSRDVQLPQAPYLL